MMPRRLDRSRLIVQLLNIMGIVLFLFAAAFTGEVRILLLLVAIVIAWGAVVVSLQFSRKEGVNKMGMQVSLFISIAEAVVLTALFLSVLI